MAPDKPFLASIADSAETVNDLRRQKEALEREIRDRQQKVNDLDVQITALNGLRQAYGYPPA